MIKRQLIRGVRSHIAMAESSSKKESKRSLVKQTDIPAHSLDDALKIPLAIIDNYAGRPTEPFNVARDTGYAPSSTTFRMLTGAATAYGLTDSGYNSKVIGVTALAKRIVKPVNASDELAARRIALLQPRIIRDFLTHYNGSPLPAKIEAAYDVLKKYGTPEDRVAGTFEMIIEGAKSVGFIEEIKGRKYVHLEQSAQAFEDAAAAVEDPEDADEDLARVGERPTAADTTDLHPTPSSKRNDGRIRRVFITHGKNTGFIDLIKKLLSFGELEPIVSVEKQSVSEPVPDKVMNEMRSCGGAIIHVDAEQRLLDADEKEHIILNPNVLIEIGAAMALYGRRFILLVREGVKLPTNLQGLYEVRYSGDTLDGDTTVRLLEAINHLKTTPPPEGV